MSRITLLYRYHNHRNWLQGRRTLFLKPQWDKGCMKGWRGARGSSSVALTYTAHLPGGSLLTSLDLPNSSFGPSFWMRGCS